MEAIGDHQGGVHGWEDNLADDTGFSDGSAHIAGKTGATATFTFTGTGVDIYSRTNDKTGMVIAMLLNFIASPYFLTRRTISIATAGIWSGREILRNAFMNQDGNNSSCLRMRFRTLRMVAWNY